MMVDAVRLVFRENDFIAKNNKKQKFLPAFLFLRFFRILFFYFSSLAFITVPFGQHHCIVNVLGHPLTEYPRRSLYGVLPLPFSCISLFHTVFVQTSCTVLSCCAMLLEWKAWNFLHQVSHQHHQSWRSLDIRILWPSFCVRQLAFLTEYQFP